MSNHRRIFVVQIVVAAAALSLRGVAAQTALPMLEESNPQAAALGYKNNTTTIDAGKFPRHAPTQDCVSCQLYMGKADDAAGACALFPGKQVAAKGWCSAWVKKTG